MKTYALLAKFWGFVFIIAGSLFLFLPETVGQNLMDIGAFIGLKGSIVSAPNTLWQILTFSLMAAITVLAFSSAKQPENKILFITLIVAKTVSVIGFLALSYVIGSVWLLPALADGVVAITLIMFYPKAVQQMAPGFAKIKANVPHYEVWYGKIDIAPGQAFWFRYTTLDGLRQEASTWAIWFKDGKVSTGKNTWPLANVAPANAVIIPDTEQMARFENQALVFHLGNNHLDGANAIGKAGEVSWDLTFTNSGHHFEHVPASVKVLGVAKSTYYACFLDLKFSGTISNGTETINLDNRPGMIGHINGKQNARNWAWAHCNSFEGDEHIIFEGISARIKDGGALGMPLTSLILITPNKSYTFSSLSKLISNKSTYGEGKWEFEARSSEAILKGTATAPDNIALVEYTDTDDSNLWCYNSKLANLTLEITDLKNNTTSSYTANQTCAFELVNRIKPNGMIDL